MLMALDVVCGVLSMAGGVCCCIGGVVHWPYNGRRVVVLFVVGLGCMYGAVRLLVGAV